MKWLTAVLISAIILFAFMPSAMSQPAAQGPQKKGPVLPKPDHQDVKYGPYERNVLDLWKAKSEKPTPLLVNIHGGGFRAGDKSSLGPGLLRLCLDSGISVASINYRYSQQAVFPAPMLDGARAVQFLRCHAEEYHLDPNRIACTGGSAGAGISLWIGFHPDLADPKSDDPVARQSTRLTCMAVFGAQCSYDPHFIKELIGGRAWEHSALLQLYGLKPEEADTPRARKLFEEAAPITYVSKDSPPVWMFYTEAKGPLPPDARPGQGIHHIKFGEALKAKLDPLGVECIVLHSDDYKGKPPGQNMRDMLEFLQRHFGAEK